MHVSLDISTKAIKKAELSAINEQLATNGKLFISPLYEKSVHRKTIAGIKSELFGLFLVYHRDLFLRILMCRSCIANNKWDVKRLTAFVVPFENVFSSLIFLLQASACWSSPQPASISIFVLLFFVRLPYNGINTTHIETHLFAFNFSYLAFSFAASASNSAHASRYLRWLLLLLIRLQIKVHATYMHSLTWSATCRKNSHDTKSYKRYLLYCNI